MNSNAGISNPTGGHLTDADPVACSAKPQPRPREAIMNSTHSEVSANALVCTRHGEPRDVLKFQQRKIADPGHGQVLVRMIAAPVNPSDLLFIQGNYGLGPTPPVVPGFEGTGIVIETGGGWLGTLHRGKRVAVLSRSGGTWGTYCIADSETLIPVPAELSDDQAAAYFINPATALLMTRCIFQVPKGEWLMQSASGSAVGRMIIRLGQHFGFRTINLVRRSEQVEELKMLGADAVLVANDQTPIPEFAAEVRDACGGILPRFAVDPVGGHTGELLLNSLDDCGRMIVYASLAESPMRLDSRTMIVHDLRIESFWLGRAMQSLSLFHKLRFLSQLSSLHRQGLFQVERFRPFTLEMYREALDAVSHHQGGEKILFRMSPGGV
jgi:NADPH:quinone reductase-like Zn-dependent oxidoreductase